MENENQADAGWKIQAHKAGAGVFPPEDTSQGHGGELWFEKNI